MDLSEPRSFGITGTAAIPGMIRAYQRRRAAVRAVKSAGMILAIAGLVYWNLPREHVVAVNMNVSYPVTLADPVTTMQIIRDGPRGLSVEERRLESIRRFNQH